jgi:hypothetical protein
MPRPVAKNENPVDAEDEATLTSDAVVVRKELLMDAYFLQDDRYFD